MEAVKTHTTQNNKIKHTSGIHRPLRPPSCKHAHSRGAAANFSSKLLKRFICFIKRFTHITFCCSKQLNRTLLLSSLTRLCSLAAISCGEQRRRLWGGECAGPNALSGGAQLLHGPTQYLTLNIVLISLEYDLYHSSCYSAYVVVIIVVVIYSYCNQQ